MTKKYVLGFYFMESRVLLIERDDHTWQQGLINGIGGHIEKDETPRQAMEREFLEETGIHIPFSSWRYLMKVGNPEEWEMSIFYFTFNKFPTVKRNPEGILRIISLHHPLPFNIETLAHWACLMCWDLINNRFKEFSI